MRSTTTPSSSGPANASKVTVHGISILNFDGFPGEQREAFLHEVTGKAS